MYSSSTSWHSRQIRNFFPTFLSWCSVRSLSFLQHGHLPHPPMRRRTLGAILPHRRTAAAGANDLPSLGGARAAAVKPCDGLPTRGVGDQAPRPVRSRAAASSAPPTRSRRTARTILAVIRPILAMTSSRPRTASASAGPSPGACPSPGTGLGKRATALCALAEREADRPSSDTMRRPYASCRSRQDLDSTPRASAVTALSYRNAAPAWAPAAAGPAARACAPIAAATPCAASATLSTDS